MITRDQFMEFFRDENFNELMSADDCVEVFRTCMKGNGDFTKKLLDEILADYSVTHLKITDESQFYFLFGSDAVRIFDEDEDKFVALVKNRDFHYFWSLVEFDNPQQLLAEYDGYDDCMSLTKEQFNKLSQAINESNNNVSTSHLFGVIKKACNIFELEYWQKFDEPILFDDQAKLYYHAFNCKKQTLLFKDLQGNEHSVKIDELDDISIMKEVREALEKWSVSADDMLPSYQP